MGEERSDVFSEPVSLPYASSLSVYLHLKHCWRLDCGCQMRRCIARKLGLVGTQRSCLFVSSALYHDQLYPSLSWQRDKHLSNLFQCLPCSLSHSSCSFFLIFLLMSNIDLSQFPVAQRAAYFLLPLWLSCLEIFFYPLSVFPLRVTQHHTHCPPLGTLQRVHLEKQFQNWAQYTN